MSSITRMVLPPILSAMISDARGGMCDLGQPVVGESLCFLIDGVPNYTSPVFAIEEREQLELPQRISPQLEAALRRRPPGTNRETY